MMKKQIMFSDINCQRRNGRIVVAEYSIGLTKARGIVQIVMSKRRVKTIHGNVNPSLIYSADNAREAQEFINAV